MAEAAGRGEKATRLGSVAPGLVGSPSAGRGTKKQRDKEEAKQRKEEQEREKPVGFGGSGVGAGKVFVVPTGLERFIKDNGAAVGRSTLWNALIKEGLIIQPKVRRSYSSKEVEDEVGSLLHNIKGLESASQATLRDLRFVPSFIPFPGRLPLLPGVLTDS